MMRNIPGPFRHVHQLASMLLLLVIDAVCDLDYQLEKWAA